MIPRLFTILFLCALLRGFAGPEEAKKPVPLDTTAVHGNLKRADTVLVVKHAYRHREQIVAGGVMMACLIGILVVMNNYNPR